MPYHSFRDKDVEKEQFASNKDSPPSNNACCAIYLSITEINFIGK